MAAVGIETGERDDLRAWLLRIALKMEHPGSTTNHADAKKFL
jgi:hypothetical protein